MSDPTFSAYRRRLPHWRLDGATYFLTWRLHRLQADLRPLERTSIVAVLSHFDGQRFRLRGYVVMNDHVHVLVAPHAPYSLQKIVHSWKSYSAYRLRMDHGRCGALWQDEYHDRIVRDRKELRRFGGYILGNPGRRRPRIVRYEWAWLENGLDG